MPAERQIYLLDPQSIDPETIAVAFAKTSRSPQSFRKIAAELTAERSAEFHEKWVVGYGHASVAEHAVLHIAMENVSRLAVETIESSRLASYTEKSTRYQKWAPEEFFTPPEIERDAPAALKELYHTTCRGMFEAYLQALPAVRKDVERDYPRLPDESDGAWERRIRSEYVDVCRFLLPAASLANLGMTINARALEHALRKMLSHPLEEVRQVGAEIKAVALSSVPTLIKYVDRVPYLEETAADLEQLASTARIETLPTDWCSLVECSAESENRVLAAALYRFGEFSYSQALLHVATLPPEERAKLAHALLGRLGNHDIPLRETEHATYTFDVLVDQGAYFELKRHRMMTQTAQALTTRLGYATPERIVTAGMGEVYHQAMANAAHAYEALAAFNPHAAGYVVPNGYNRRVLLGMNLRSARHFISLRAAENAHFSMRRLALRVAEEIRLATPLLGQYLHMPTSQTWQEIQANTFSSTGV
jgi:thymidylate synthase ThyX